MMECHFCALPRTPFPASRDFAPVGSMSLDFQVASLSYKSSSFATSRGNERYEGKNSESYTSRTISAFPPFGGWRHHLPPHFVVGLWVLSNGAMSLQESIECFILSPGWGGKGTRFVREQSDLRIV